MLAHIVAAFGGQLPDDVKVVFANTGREHPRTLDFVARCQSEWGVNIDWLEYDWNSPHRYRVVSHNSASRDGEPYAALIERKGFVPNSTIRFCTSFLKRDPIQRHARYGYGFDAHTGAIGFRADEWRRVARMMQSCSAGDRPFRERVVMPMADAGVREPDVKAWWRRQTFDLEIPSEAGNCDLCFLKSRRKIMRLIREEPALADWWIEQERKAEEIGVTVRGRTAEAPYQRFRENPTETYARLRDAALAQGDFLFGPDKPSGIDCICGD